MGVAIAGSGLISVFGDLQQTWEKLVAGQFISDHAKADRGVVELAQDAARQAVGEAGGNEQQIKTAGLGLGARKGKGGDWLGGGGGGPTGVGAGAGGVGGTTWAGLT